MFNINDIKKRQGGLDFDETLSVKDILLERHPEMIDVAEVHAKGNVSYEKDLYLLTYHLSYQLTLPSSRSMTPVVLEDTYTVIETFSDDLDNLDHQDMLEDELVLPVENGQISLVDSVVDNILLNIPLKVLTPEEEEDAQLPSGNHWTVLTQEQYQAQQAEKKKEKNPFAALSGLFDQSDDN